MRRWSAAPNRVPTSVTDEVNRVVATKQTKPRVGVPSLIERGALLVIAASLVLFPLFVRDTRIRVRHTAEQNQTNTARALADDIQHHLEGFERSLRSASAVLRFRNIWEVPANIRNAAIFDGSSEVPNVSSVLIIDHDGQMMANSGDISPPAVNYVDRDYFRFHQADPSLAVHVSGPISGRLTGRKMMIFSIRLNDERGDFAGVVAGAIAVSYFDNLLMSLEPAADAAITLVQFNGTLIARAPSKANAAGANVSAGPLFRNFSHARAGTYIDHTLLDGTERLVAYQTLGEFPLLVAYSQSTVAVFAGWLHMVYFVGAALLAMCGLKVCAIWLLRREHARRLRAEQAAELSAAAVAAVNRSLEERINVALAVQERAQETLETGQRLEALGQLSGGIAHDINNVLQTISGACSLMEARQHDPEHVKRLSAIALRAADRGTVVTRRLLAFAKRGNLRAEEVDPIAVLVDMQELLNHTLMGSIVVELNLPPWLPMILVDRMQLETVLVNIANNARDATPSGGTITISARQEAVNESGAQAAGLSAGSYVRLIVHDRGIGMDAKTLARAVDPFFSTKGPGQGTGLGLSMAKGFVEQSGGKLDIVSRIGEGSTVTLSFPAVGTGGVPRTSERGIPTFNTGAAAPTTPPVFVALTPSESGGGSATVLVVDDNQQSRELVCEWLSACRFEVHQATSGEAALATLEGGLEIDMLLTDFSMPGMNGIELARAVRKRVPGQPVIILTGNTGTIAIDAIGAAAGGECMVLQKPIRISELPDHIKIALRRSPASQSSLALLANLASGGGTLP
jgi:signal transduction histidine kinase/ActR/RegA family two-component response regulator